MPWRKLSLSISSSAPPATYRSWAPASWYCITLSSWIFLYTILHNSWPGGSLLLLGCWLDTPTALIFQNGSWPCLSAVQLPGCCVMWRSICSNSHCVGNHRKSAATLKNRPRLEPVLCSKVCACDCSLIGFGQVWSICFDWVLLKTVWFGMDFQF